MSSASTDLQDYTYYFVPAPWLSCKLLRLLQCYPPPEDGAVKGRLVECLETILNKAQEPPKSKKVQHSNAKNAILFEAISLIIHYDRWASINSALYTQVTLLPNVCVTNWTECCLVLSHGYGTTMEMLQILYNTSTNLALLLQCFIVKELKHSWK